MKQTKTFNAMDYRDGSKIEGFVRYGNIGHHITIRRNGRKVAEFTIPATILDKPRNEQTASKAICNHSRARAIVPARTGQCD
jgi:hypothetical protein